MTTEPNRTVEVSARGDAPSPSADGSTYKLTVQTSDPTARIVVVDEQFDAVAKAAGSLVKELPAGFYKVRVQRGASSSGFEDRLLSLDRDLTVSIDPPKYVSSAPIGSSQVSDAHVAAREWLDAVTHVSLGKGSKIAILARYAAPSEQSGEPIHPFCGLELLSVDGQQLVDLKQAMPTPHVPDSRAPISICGIQVDPGTYVLRHSLADGRSMAQSIVTTGGWQIGVNILRSEQDMNVEKSTFARPGYLAVLMRRLINDQSAHPAALRSSNEGPIDEDQLIDVARQGLADGAQLLSDHLYGIYLKDFENPLVGILGGLLLDLEREAQGERFQSEHAALFDQAVTKLRSMLGTQHPDVEALSFRCNDKRLAHRGTIKAQPMFYRSWRILLEAASSRSGLLSLDLWKQTIAAGTMPPYLIWFEGNVRRARLRQLTKVASNLTTHGVVVADEPARPTQRALRNVARAPLPKGIGGERSASSAVEGAGLQTQASRPRTQKLSHQQVALTMHVPANALFELIGTVTKLAAKALTKSSGAKAAAKRKRSAAASKRSSKSGIKTAGKPTSKTSARVKAPAATRKTAPANRKARRRR